MESGKWVNRLFVAFCLPIVFIASRGWAGELQFNGKIQAAFGVTQYLDFVDGPSGRALDSDFDATRELSLKLQWIANENLKAVASFQLGEGSTGGYFGSTDALVGGEEDGDLIIELDELYLDFNVPDTPLSFKVGSQGIAFSDAIYGSNIMYEVPAGVLMTVKFNETSSLKASWFRIADLMDDTENNMDDQADLFWAELPVKFGGLQLTPYGGYANIQQSVILNSPSHWRYAYINYPGLLRETYDSIGSQEAALPTDDVNAYYAGLALAFEPVERLLIRATGTYGDMSWETATEDVSIAGFFADMAISYKTDIVTPEIFGFWGDGPDKNDEDFAMMPPLIGGPTYTSSFFGGSRYNDNMFDSHDVTYATSMMAIGVKLKEIKFGERLKSEFQAMYAVGTAEDSIFQAPYDALMNDDESFIELNFNSEYEIMKNFLAALELGYIMFDEDDDYDETLNGSVEDFWKVAFSLEYAF